MSAIFFLVIFTFFFTYLSGAHNITAVLDDFPEYSIYNSYLSQTKLSDDINSRETITILVVTNPLITILAAKQPLYLIKKVLQLHTLLDYFDDSKLHSNFKSSLVTTLLQTTGTATGRLGFLNITDLKDGKIGFMSPASQSFQCFYTKSVREIPYSISVLEISKPVVYPGLFDDPETDLLNITGILNRAGCKTFASWITKTLVINTYYVSRVQGEGVTIFAPTDGAFNAPGVPNLTEMTRLSAMTLLMYHALPEYVPKPSFVYKNSSMSTLATNDFGQYKLTVDTKGNTVTLSTGVVTSKVIGTVVDAVPLSILTVDKVLLPVEQFGKPSPSPAPSVPPESSDASAPAPVEPNAPYPSPEVPPADIIRNAYGSLKNPSSALVILFATVIPLF